MLVSNTSTLILLGKVNMLSAMLDNVKEIAIPKVVYHEIRKKDSFEVLTINREVKKGRIKVFDIDKKDYAGIIREFKLDDGEAAAYALLKKIKGKAILTDDGELIKLCKIDGVSFMISMAVVVKMFKNNKLNKSEAIEKLDKLYDYGRYSEEIYRFFRSEVS